MHRILLDVGHGYYDESIDGHASWDNGALGSEGTREFDLNLITAVTVQERLQSLGHYAAFIPFGLSRYDRGLFARDFDVFISIHHNASGNHGAQGSEVCTHTSLATDADRQLALSLSKIMAGALKILNRGPRPMNLEILRGARKTNVRAAVLTEGFFMDRPGSTHFQLTQWCRIEGLAMAGGIDEFLKG